MTISYYGPGADSPDVARLRHDNAELKKFVFELSQAPAPLALVIDREGDQVLLTRGGGPILTPANGLDLQPGDWVKVVEQTGNPICKVTFSPIGPNVPVSRCLPDGTLEVQNRRVRRGKDLEKVELKEGDHVVCDPYGFVALRRGFDPPPKQEFAETLNVPWDAIGGCEAAKEALREAIEYPITHRALYKAYSKKPAKGVLLYGPPGCGKTMLGKALATSVSGSGGFFYVKGPELLDKFVGETEKQIRELFAKARKWAEGKEKSAILYIDEADAILGVRGGNSHSIGALTATIVPQFLSEMDGLSESKVFVLLATNRPSDLDPAVVRPGRIDRKIRIDRPTRAEAEGILKIHLDGRPIVGELGQLIDRTIQSAWEAKIRDIAEVDGRTIALHLKDMMSGAVLAGIVERAVEAAIARDRRNSNAEPSGVGASDLEQAATELAAELADTDIREPAYERIACEVGREKAAAHKPPNREAMN